MPVSPYLGENSGHGVFFSKTLLKIHCRQGAVISTDFFRTKNHVEQPPLLTGAETLQRFLVIKYIL